VSGHDRQENAARILFLMAEVVRKNFAGARERRMRLTKAVLALTGEPYASESMQGTINRELSK
jgi:hypothetical protein